MLSQSTIQFLQIAGTWVASIGTVSAVIVSLWLARRNDSVRLAISVFQGGFFDTDGEHETDYIIFSITNIGRRPVRISGIGWRSGLFGKGRFRKIHIMQFPWGHDTNSKMPCELKDGEVAQYSIPMYADGSNFLRSIHTKAMPSFIHRWTFRAVVQTTNGGVFKIKPSPTFYEGLKESLELAGVD